MPLLAATITNTYTTLGLFDPVPAPGQRGEVVAHWRVGTDRRRTPDEWSVLLRGLLAEATDPAALSGASVCATVPSVLRAWRTMLPAVFPGVPVVIVEPGVRTGVPVRTDNPREVGADRVMNAVAASTRFGGPAVVVDFGTATTFDVIDERGQYVGGAIAPGIELSLDALGRRAAQLHEVELRRPDQVIGKNTVEALQSGLVFGMAGQVDGMVRRIVAELGCPPAQVTVIATGHGAELIVAECPVLAHHEPWLTLHGLAEVFARNSR